MLSKETVGLNIVDKGEIISSIECETNTEGDELEVEFEVERETSEDENVSFCRRIKENRVLRLRILHTILIAWATFAVGWRMAMVGPTFPDLIQIIGVDVSVGSWLLTAFFIGNVIGSLTAGILYDRFNKLVVIIGCMVLLSVSSAVIPWCSSFVPMIVTHVVSGAAYGASDVVTITDVLHVWGSRSASVLQLTQFMYGLGAIISPLVAAPFLSTRKDGMNVNILMNMANTTVLHSFNLTEATNILPDMNGFMNISNTTSHQGLNLTEAAVAIGTLHNNGKIIAAPEISNVYIAYLIAAILSLVNSVAFIPYCILYKDVYRLFTKDTQRSVSKSNRKDTHAFSKRTKFYFICAIAMIFMIQMLAERNFVSYFMTYVTIKEGWTKSVGSAAFSLYYIAVTVGRLLASPLLAFVGLTKSIFLYLGMSTTAVLCFAFKIYLDADFIIWVSLVILGLSLGPLFTGWISWLSDNIIQASGKITGTLYIIAVLACSFFPPLIGHLMKTYTYDWLVYILLILVPLMFVMFLVVVCIHRRLIKK